MNPVGLADFENPSAILEIRFNARTAYPGSRGASHHLEVVPRGLGKIDQLLVDQSFHPAKGSIELNNVRILAGLENSSHQGLINDSGGTAPHGDYGLTGQSFHLYSLQFHGSLRFRSYSLPLLHSMDDPSVCRRSKG
jgi:hypothetical protein